MILQKILVATGDSPDSQKIFETGLTFAEKLGAKISFLHVLTPTPMGLELFDNPGMGTIAPMISDSAMARSTAEWQDYERFGIERLQLYAKQAQAHHVAAEIFQNFGDPGRVICETAADIAADLIVIGSHQKSRLSEILVGSTSSYVFHHAPCSVTIVRA
jgi:nucleotide-binding universal stress UspA family protein